MKLSEVLRNEHCWTQRSYARDNDNEPVIPESSEAVKFCLLGAAKRIAGGDRESITFTKITDSIQTAINKCYPNKVCTYTFGGILSFNDSPTTTWNDIQRVVAEVDKQNKWYKFIWRKTCKFIGLT